MSAAGQKMSAATTPGSDDAPAATPARAWRLALETTARATRDPERILPRAVSEWAVTYGDSPALVSDRESFSFRALEARMNQYSRWALGAGVRRGETVALVMGNRPEYFAIWLGLTQIGAIVALIGRDLPRARAGPCLASRRGAPLDRRRRMRRGLCGGDRRTTTPSRFGSTAASGSTRAELTLRFRREAANRSRQTNGVHSRSPIGRCGFSPPVRQACRRQPRSVIAGSSSGAHWFAGLAGLTAADRLYNCLPMHHSVGGVVALGAPLVDGGSVVIVERFSAHGFWDEVTRWDCTAFQYIGELCRYLAAAPRRSRRKRATGSGSRSATGFPEPSGARFWIGSDRSASSNFTLRLKATSGSTTSRAGSDRSAGCRRISRCATQSRSRASTLTRKRLCAAPMASASVAPTARLAKPWGASAKTPARASRATAKAMKRKRKSCATSSWRATRGCEPATSCAATPTASTFSSIASATPFVGRGRTSRRSKLRRRSAHVRASRTRSSMESLFQAPTGARGWRS